jgi:hypothetical protein
LPSVSAGTEGAGIGSSLSGSAAGEGEAEGVALEVCVAAGFSSAIDVVVVGSASSWLVDVEEGFATKTGLPFVGATTVIGSSDLASETLLGLGAGFLLELETSLGVQADELDVVVGSTQVDVSCLVEVLEIDDEGGADHVDVSGAGSGLLGEEFPPSATGVPSVDQIWRSKISPVVFHQLMSQCDWYGESSQVIPPSLPAPQLFSPKTSAKTVEEKSRPPCTP